MILYADGHPVDRRYSVGFVGSLLAHVVIITAMLSYTGEAPPADPFAAQGASGSGGRASLHSPALLRSGQVGGEPTGSAGAVQRRWKRPRGRSGRSNGFS